MGKNLVRKDFVATTTWACPAGVNRVRVVTTAILPQQLANAGVIVQQSCAAYLWGSGVSGAIGDNTSVSKSTPTLIATANAWRQVNNLGLDGGTSWGLSFGGDLYRWGVGLPNLTNVAVPTIISSALHFKQMDGFYQQVIALSTGNGAYTMGLNASGQLGDGTVLSRSTPTLVLGSHTWKYVAAGNGGSSNGSCAAITSDDDLYAWGYNVNGQLGDGTIVAKSSPVLVSGGLKWRTVAISDYSMIGLTTDGNIYAWGLNANGQLGVGDVLARSTPTLVTGSAKQFTAISTCGPFMGALDNLGRLWCWGLNASGQLGDGTVVAKSTPTLVSTGSRFEQFRCGFDSVLAGDLGGNLYSWGGNTKGQLGLNDTVPRSTPTLITSGGLKPSMVPRAVVNDVVINVNPGTTYPVTFDNVTVFGSQALYEDPYGNGTLATRITLEYEA